MKSYELTVLVRNEKEVDAVKAIITEFSGKVGKEEKWGKRDLAFPIAKEKSAFFFTYQLELDPKSISEMKKKMNYDEKIVRYLLISRG
jgi:small subunit ribosomal protein S6